MNHFESSASGLSASVLAMIFKLVPVGDLFTAFLCGVCGAAGGWIFKFGIDKIKKYREKNS
ncbi:hypothetical protein [Persicobacter sp. CCB-QB2]|uniref:hypothetical protein n=1 Tax=Persicobacter sp. CCB-QB2 TaxID=1561025 RepID=UPI0006A9B0B9|nr:hypothetical protein [Persicobacter sp. CCB-QB2]